MSFCVCAFSFFTYYFFIFFFFFFQAEDGIRDVAVTGVQTCALPISRSGPIPPARGTPRTEEGIPMNSQAQFWVETVALWQPFVSAFRFIWGAAEDRKSVV